MSLNIFDAAAASVAIVAARDGAVGVGGLAALTVPHLRVLVQLTGRRLFYDVDLGDLVVEMDRPGLAADFIGDARLPEEARTPGDGRDGEEVLGALLHYGVELWVLDEQDVEDECQDDQYQHHDHHHQACVGTLVCPGGVTGVFVSHLFPYHTWNTDSIARLSTSWKNIVYTN